MALGEHGTGTVIPEHGAMLKVFNTLINLTKNWSKNGHGQKSIHRNLRF